MKKVYASMIAVACAALITSSAKTLEPVNVEVKSHATQLSVVDQNVKAFEGKTINHNNVNMAKSRAGEEWQEIGTGYFYDAIFENEEVEVTIEQNVNDPSQYRIPDAWSYLGIPNPLPLYIDASVPECVVLPYQETGVVYSDAGPVYIMSFSAYYLMEGATLEDFMEYEPDKVITLENNIVTIPAAALLASYPEYTDDLYYANQDDMYILFPDAPLSPQWGEKKESQCLEGFIQPMFVDPEEMNHEPITVTVQANNWVEDVYRVFDLWQNVAAFAGVDLVGAPMIIDATDPTCLVVPYQKTGVSVGDRGITYIGNECGMFYESISDFFADPEHSDPWTLTEADGVKTINIPAPYGMFWNWPQWTGNENQAYYTSASFESWIVLPVFSGINDVKVDNQEAVNEYYNIQGMKVNNPQKGQVYIIKNGNKVTKTIIK